MKIFPTDYKRVLAELAAAEAAASNGAPSANGASRLRESATTRRRSANARSMGELGAFLKIERVGVPYRDPLERAQGLRGVH